MLITVIFPVITMGADDDSIYLPVKYLMILEKDSFHVKGNFKIINDSAAIVSNLDYKTELYLQVDTTSNLINSEVTQFSVGPMETLQFNFDHKTPYELAKGMYFLIVRAVDRTGLDVGFTKYDLGEMGSDRPMIIYRPKQSYYLLDSKKVPSFDGQDL